MRHHRTIRAARVLVAAVLTTAAVFGASPATALAAPPPPGDAVVGPRPTENAPPERYTDAPTAGLRKLAQSLTFRYRSVTTIVAAPAHLGLSTPTEISVLFGGERVTQQYRDSTGTRLRRDFPAGDGTPRREPVTITLRELVPNGRSYSIVSRADLVPQFTVIFGNLHWQEIGDCDLASLADPEIKFVRADGTPVDAGEVDVDNFGGAVVPAFAVTFREVDVRTTLRMPTVSWVEGDPGVEFHPFPPLPSEPLLPGTTRTVSWVDTSESDCDARFSYDLRFVPETFPLL